MAQNPAHDDLYDAFLDALLDGDAPNPKEFLTQADVDDPKLAEKLQGLLEASRILPAATTFSEEDTVDGLPYQRLGEFRLLTRLGSGGMGTVYLAEQESLGRRVALKVIRPELIGSPSASLRFQREAKSLARIQHPNVVTIFGYGVDQGAHYLAMEFVPGLDLTETLQDAQEAELDLPPADAVRWALEIARALQCVHDEGLMHRDVKASNIRITPEGRAVLVDFGLATEPDDDGPTITRSFVGSPATASPEQIADHHEIDARTDVYSLGITLYRCITGSVPFQGSSMEAIFHQVLNSQPIPPRKLRPGIPRDLEIVILHAMEKDAERRYQTATAFANDLEAVLEFRPIQAQPPAWTRRVSHWVRCHRASAATLLTTGVAILAGIVFLVVQVEQDRRLTEQTALDRLKDARTTLTEFVRLGEENQTLKNRVLSTTMLFETTHVPKEKINQLDSVRNQYRTALIQRERLFNQALEYLKQAERLNPTIPGADLVRAELYVTRYREALDETNRVASRFYRERAHHFDDGTVWKRMMEPNEIRLLIDPPGPVTVFPFRYLEHDQVVSGGDPRMVPVPGLVGDPLPIPEDLPFAPGTWCLRVIEDLAPARKGDYLFTIAGVEIQSSVFVLRGNQRPEPGRLVSIHRLDRLTHADGVEVVDAYAVDKFTQQPEQIRQWTLERNGEPYQLTASFADLDIQLGTATELALQGDCTAQLARGGDVISIAVPAGLKTRVSASPRPLLESFSFEHTSVDQVIKIEQGVQAFLVRRPGYEDSFVQIGATRQEDFLVPVPLVLANTTPNGFARINPQPGWKLGPFWLMDREVTSAEYLEFLNDPATQAEITQSSHPIRFPRTVRNEATGGSWPRDPDGLYHLPTDWPANWPAFGVSWHDAVRFAEWKTQQARAQGLPHTYRLPILTEFRLAAKGNTLWDYPYGSDFRPIWSNCCFSRPKPEPEPVLRYPLDASIFDIYDCSGSALEWVNAWWDQDHIKRFAAGGSWAQGGATAAKPAAGLGIRPNSTSLEASFRLVLEIEE
jgi:serine/threonine protein kinase/formylglycine-generating enzyme required for sulfatase activity